MTDLKAGTTTAPQPKKGYIPPNLRSGKTDTKSELPANLDGMNFPSLGMAAPVQKVIPNFKKTVLEQIEKEHMDEAERNKAKETDVSKMTREQRIADGWAVLSLSHQAVKLAGERLNTPSPIEESEFL